MGLQDQFLDFNKTIKMDYDELTELADKREKLLKKLKDSDDIPAFEQFNQGSYAMYTGVVPLDKEYDIDVGLRFKVNKEDYDVLELKKKIKEVLKNHTATEPEIKKPCVTVSYKKDGEIAYHVDLVAYAYEDKDDTNSQLYLARGTNDSNKEWEEADPLGLIKEIADHFTDTDERNQYRRIIRYMKRWKNIKFNSNGNGEPPGIGITLLAYNLFEPCKTYDFVTCKYKFNDLEALIKFVESVKNKFIFTYCTKEEKWLYTISIDLPVKPNKNVFCKMTNIQMNTFKEKIDTLLVDLNAVKAESDIVEQCTKLSKILGEDFPIPAKEDESKTQRNFVPPSSASGMDK